MRVTTGRARRSTRPVTVGLAVATTSALVACGATGSNLQRLSASVITPTPYPDSVKITELHQGVAGFNTWVATTSYGVYDCSQETGEPYPICARRHTKAPENR